MHVLLLCVDKYFFAMT